MVGASEQEGQAELLRVLRTVESCTIRQVGARETAVLLLLDVSLTVLVAQKLDDLPDFCGHELI